MKQYVINGGGMVGAAAALALAEQGHQVTLVDLQPPGAARPAWDLRISSVNQHHWLWLNSLGLEQTIDTQKVMPYTDLSVTTQSGDTLCFGAADVNLPQLGVMVENNTLQRALWELLSEHPRVSLKVPERITEFDLAQQRVVLASGEACDYDVLIGADGANSQVAQAINISYRGWDYGQRCLLANVRLSQPQAAATWEVFRPQGPFALLPLTDQQACLIDYRSSAEINCISRDESTLTAALHQTFADRIGAFELLSHASFPLQRKHALNYSDGQSVVLMGDAAHTIHPLAGQGVNLGFADIRSWLNCNSDIAAYEQARKTENQRMMRAMDMINWGFRSQNPLLKLGLRAAFKGFDVLGLKQQVIARAMQT